MAKDLLSTVTKQNDISRPFFGLCKEITGLTYVEHVLMCFDHVFILPISQII